MSARELLDATDALVAAETAALNRRIAMLLAENARLAQELRAALMERTPFRGGDFPDFRDYPQPARPDLDLDCAGRPLRQGS